MTSLQEMNAYIERGISVFPVCVPTGNGCLHHPKCKNPGKTPLVTWTQFQTRIASQSEINHWFRQFGETNIAMATGEVSNIVVLDIDSPSAQEHVLSHGVTKGPVVLTGKPGGSHLWLQWPGYELRNFADRVPNLDFRGSGGYVLVPSSLHANGIKYRWLDGTKDLPLPPVPAWVNDLAQKPDIQIKGDSWIARALSNLKEGNRNETLHQIGGLLRRFGCTKDDIFILLRPHAISVGLSLEELDILCVSAVRYTPDHDYNTFLEKEERRVELRRNEDGSIDFIRTV